MLHATRARSHNLTLHKRMGKALAARARADARTRGCAPREPALVCDCVVPYHLSVGHGRVQARAQVAQKVLEVAQLAGRQRVLDVDEPALGMEEGEEGAISGRRRRVIARGPAGCAGRRRPRAHRCPRRVALARRAAALLAPKQRGVTSSARGAASRTSKP